MTDRPTPAFIPRPFLGIVNRFRAGYVYNVSMGQWVKKPEPVTAFDCLESTSTIRWEATRTTSPDSCWICKHPKGGMVVFFSLSKTVAEVELCPGCLQSVLSHALQNLTLDKRIEIYEMVRNRRIYDDTDGRDLPPAA